MTTRTPLDPNRLAIAETVQDMGRSFCVSTDIAFASDADVRAALRWTGPSGRAHSILEPLYRVARLMIGEFQPLSEARGGTPAACGRCVPT